MPKNSKSRSKFAQWLLVEIARAGLTQQELAFHAGLHENTISKLMQSKGHPKITTFLYICEALAAFQLHEEFTRAEKQQLADQLFLEGIRKL